ncbi:hypothetical protein DSO57_1039166 [Entomophthora muscae]|uniref:Uncharacterized protein n=1 Tax=Entomophthora muscae TaxID=34485 RepID=A0ACC2U8F1_9FUNG|nr:hypothetical protein DSO57_1039166 [Entomophthora muscae]
MSVNLIANSRPDTLIQEIDVTVVQLTAIAEIDIQVQSCFIFILSLIHLKGKSTKIAEAIVFDDNASLFIKVFGDDILQLVPGKSLTLLNGRLEQVLGEVRLVVRPPLGRVEENSKIKSQGEASSARENHLKLKANRSRVRHRHVRQESLSKDKLNISYLDHEYFLY